MPTLDKKPRSERDICSRFTTPALVSAKRADYLLYFKPGIPLAVVEAILHLSDEIQPTR